jgi:hypothetical protein
MTCAALLTGPRAQAGESQDRLRQQLVDLEKRSWEAWKSRDGAFFSGFLSDDHLEVGAGGPVGKAAVVSFVGSPVCVVESYHLENFALTVLDEKTAVLTYHAAQTTTCNGAPVPSPVWATSVYVKRDGKWWNALYQQTPDLRRPAGPASSEASSVQP